MKKPKSQFRCGQVALVGRPNVGKSTLLNHLIGQKLSITSRKPQTTRHRILGIKTLPDAQIIYVDTPGLHQNVHHALNRYMNRTANSVLFDVDLILFMVDALHWSEDDEWVLKKVQRATAPVILIVNKIDKVTDKSALLPYLQDVSSKSAFAHVVPMCARKAAHIEKLQAMILQYLPETPAQFPVDQITDLSQRFFAGEIIREKIMHYLGQELPYAATVDIEEFKQEESGLLRIAAVIYVDKSGQKPIVIGAHGQRLKQIGQAARLDMENLFDAKVFLQLWVKVKQGWADDEKALQNFGYGTR